MSTSTLKAGISVTVTAICAMAIWSAGAAAAPVAELTPPEHAFGDQVIKTESANYDFTLSNTNTPDGGFTVVSVDKGGQNPGQFNLKPATNCTPGLVLDENDGQCRIRVSFKPGSLGNKAATVEVVTSLSATPLTVEITGKGVAAPVVTAGLSSIAVPFEARDIGEGPSVPRTIVLSSLGALPLQVGAVTIGGVDASQFPSDLTGCQNRTLNQGQSCQVSVTFDPDTPGAKRAQVSFATNAPNSPSIVSLAGEATTPPKPTRLDVTKTLPKVTGNSVRLPVTCVKGGSTACKGSVALSVKGSALGRKGKQAKRLFRVGGRSFAVDGRFDILSVKLKGFALKSLRKRGKLPLRVTIKVKQPDSTYRSRTLSRTAKAKAKRARKR